VSSEFLHIALGVGAFLAATCVVGFQLVKSVPTQRNQSNDPKCDRSFTPWYFASLKSAVVFGAIVPIAYALFGMFLTGGRLEIFSLALGFMVAVPIGLTYGFINSFIVRRVTLGAFGRFSLGFVSGQLVIVLPMLSQSLKATIGLVTGIPIFGLIILVIGGLPAALCAVLVTRKLQQWVFLASVSGDSGPD